MVKSILDYHILPPVPVINTVWTTPFFSALRGPVTTSSSGNSVAITAGTKCAPSPSLAQAGLAPQACALGQHCSCICMHVQRSMSVEGASAVLTAFLKG